LQQQQVQAQAQQQVGQQQVEPQRGNLSNMWRA
jgi:hypothetical protein